ncbi:N-terminal glutamine amidase-domain-containing protein [Fomes fomentarius]|nr:N-terminal glutamine amidase-domain-containing protein [Fomes fomentarius]
MSVMASTSPPLFLPPDSVYTSCYCEENAYLLAKSFAVEGEILGRSAPWPWEVYVVFVSNSGKTVALWNQKARDGVVVWDYHVFLVLRPRPRILPHLGAGTSSDLDHATCAPWSHSPQSDVHSASDSAQDDCGPPTQSPDGDQAWVYDFDTTLAVPCPWREYVAGTFPYAFNDELVPLVDTRFLSLFRVVPADVYLDYFASDRSHMIVNGEMESASGSDADEVDKIINGAGVPHGPRYSMPPPPYPPLCGAKARELGIVHNLMESFVAMDVISGAAISVSDGRTVAEDEGTYSAPGFAGEIATSGVGAGARASSSLARYGQVMDIGGFMQ